MCCLLWTVNLQGLCQVYFAHWLWFPIILQSWKSQRWSVWDPVDKAPGILCSHRLPWVLWGGFMGCRLDWSTLAVQAWLQINTDLLSGLEGHRKAPCVGWPCLETPGQWGRSWFHQDQPDLSLSTRFWESGYDFRVVKSPQNPSRHLEIPDAS